MIDRSISDLAFAAKLIDFEKAAMQVSKDVFETPLLPLRLDDRNLMLKAECLQSLGSFKIRAGVRQGCVMSPILFCAAMEFAMRKWKLRVGHAGWDLGDNMPNLLEVRFADDLLLFGKSSQEIADFVDVLVEELGRVGLVLNASKTIVFTTEAQPPPTVVTGSGFI